MCYEMKTGLKPSSLEAHSSHGLNFSPPNTKRVLPKYTVEQAASWAANTACPVTASLNNMGELQEEKMRE